MFQAYFLLVLLLHTGPALAQVWKYVDSNGLMHFTNQPVSQAELIITAYIAKHPQEPLAGQPDRQTIKILDVIEAKASYKNAQPQLMAAAQTHGVDYALLNAVAATESAFNPNAVSPKGAVGLMQIMPATAEQYGLRSDPGFPLSLKLKEEQVNIQIGTRLLADLSRRYPGRLDLVLAAYNAGQGAVSRAGHQIPNYRETQDYVRKVMAVYQVLQSRR